MMFPDLASLERSKVSQEYIFGGSIAINRTLGLFRDLTTQPHQPYDTLFVNLWTLYDNVYDDQLSEKEVIQKVVHEIDILIQYYAIYAGIMKIPASMLIYSPMYQIPDIVRRDISNNKKGRAFAVYQKTRDQFAMQATPIDRSIPVWMTPIGQRAPVYKDLHRYGLRMKSTMSQPAIITHVAYDLHCQDNGLSQIQMLERYTGRIRLAKDFGTKVLLSSALPFTLVTHALMGDDTLVKPRILSRVKQQIIQTAERESWKLLSKGMVHDKIRAITGLSDKELWILRR